MAKIHTHITVANVPTLILVSKIWVLRVKQECAILFFLFLQ